MPAPASPAAAPVPEKPPAGIASAPVPDGPKVEVSAQDAGDALELAFAWDRAVPAAVLERGGMVWVLFGAGTAQVEGWDALARPELAGWLAPALSEQEGDVRLFALALQRPAVLAVEREGAAWRIRLTSGEGPSAAPATPGLIREGAPDRLAAAVEGGMLAAIPDPVTGERLGVLLADAAGPRQAARQHLVDLELLPTAQGLAWRPLTDDLAAAVEDGRLTLSRPGGLRLSPEPAPVLAQAAPPAGDAPAPAAGPSALPEPATAGAPAMPAAPLAAAASATPAGAAVPAALPVEAAPVSAFGLAALGATDAAGRQARRRALQAGLAVLPAAERTRARLELARLLLADGLAPEALGVLALVESDNMNDPALTRSRAALVGAAAALAEAPEQALAALRDPALDGDPEAPLWRLLAAAQAGRWDEAAQVWAGTDNLLDRYPLPLRRLLAPALAAAMLDHGLAGAALGVVEPLRAGEPEPRERAALGLLAARALLDAGRAAEADGPLATAAADGDQNVQAEAAFLAVRQGRERGELAAAEARDRLRAIRPAWRDHPAAARMLRYLAGLERDAGDELAAVGSLRAALERTAEPGAADAIRGELRGTLAGLLAPENPAGLSPVAAVALYRGQADLLGGDALSAASRLALATRAAEAGLAESAAHLLETAGPVAGPDADRAHLALAEARTAAGDPATALALPGGSAGRARPERERLARARAALAVGDPKAALTALAGPLAGEEAGRLRRQALAAMGDWPALAEAAEAALAGDTDAGPLAPDRADTLAWLALARARLGQRDAVRKLAQRHAGRLPEDGPWQPVLTLAAAPWLAAAEPAALAHQAGTLAAALRTGLGLPPPGLAAGARTAPSR
jgi:hypothetical protein